MVKSIIFLLVLALSFGYHSKDESYDEPVCEVDDNLKMFYFVRDRIQWMESGNRHYWKSGKLKIGPAGEIGIRQLTMATAEWVKMKFSLPGSAGDISNRETNIIYSNLLIWWTRTNDWRPWPEVASSYNYGPNSPALNVQYLGCIMKTTNYLNGKKILRYLNDNTNYPVYEKWN